MPGKQHQTPKKARIQGAFEFMKAKGIPFIKSDLFDFFEVSRRSGSRILAAESSRTRHNNPDLEETRGRPTKVMEANLDSLEDLYEKEGFEARRLPWQAAATAAGIESEPSSRTISRRAASRDLYKRLAAQVKFRK